MLLVYGVVLVTCFNSATKTYAQKPTQEHFYSSANLMLVEVRLRERGRKQ